MGQLLIHAERGSSVMLTTYTRLMDAQKTTRTGSTTYDNRSQGELVKQLQAEVEALRLRVRELTGERPEEPAGVARRATR